MPWRLNVFFLILKATGEQLICLHRGSCRKIVRWERQGEKHGLERGESEIQRQFGLIMLIFPSPAKQRHPGTFRHTSKDHLQLHFSLTPQWISLEANPIISSSMLKFANNICVSVIYKGSNWDQSLALLQVLMRCFSQRNTTDSHYYIIHHHWSSLSTSFCARHIAFTGAMYHTQS